MNGKNRRRTARKPLAVRGAIQLDRDGGRFLSGRRIALLEAVDKLGSITAAAKRAGLSYKGAWDAVDALANLTDEPVVIRATGGKGGGGTRLTDYGRQLVHLYRQLEGGHERLLSRMQSAVSNPQRLGQVLKAIGMRTSARNQFRGTVKSVLRGAVNSEVTLAIGDGFEIVASITNVSVRELGLKRGREAQALIKSSFVLLSPDADLRISARNRLYGTVASVDQGAINSEVKLRLTGNRTIVAIATQQSIERLGLRAGSPCVALIKASHVLVAVND